jgi:hypothetical protein
MLPRPSRRSSQHRSLLQPTEEAFHEWFKLPLITRWNGGTTEKRLNSFSTFLWRHQTGDRPHEDRRQVGAELLLGELGDKINALLCGAGHNIRIILKKLREMFLFFCLGRKVAFFKGD